MQNTFRGPYKRIFSKAEDAAQGCHVHETPLNIKQNKESDVRADLSTAMTTDDSYQAAKGGKTTAVHTHRTALKDARAFAQITRETLKPHLGNQWSPMWAEAGFTTGTLKIPTRSEDVLPLLLSIKSYLTAHPSYEADQVGVTADAATDKHTALSTARTNINGCKSDCGTKRSQRDGAVKGLRTRLRGLVTELKQLLPGDDARWHSFGFNPPDAVGLPDVPEHLVVTPGIAGHLSAVWQGASLADRYRLYRKIIGVDSDYVLVKTVTGTEADLNTFTTGQVAKVRVSALNDAGEGLLSEPVEQTVP